METSEGVEVQADIYGLPKTAPGFFGFHLHDGVCGNPGTDPANAFPESGENTITRENLPHPSHAGDFPSLLETSAGSAHLAFITSRFTIEEAVGKAVVIHLNPNDFTTQPSGNSGTQNRLRIGDAEISFLCVLFIDPYGIRCFFIKPSTSFTPIQMGSWEVEWSYARNPFIFRQ